MEKEKVAVVVKTSGIEYDDRVRKISLALSKHFYVKIFAVEDTNRVFSGKTSYGIDCEIIKLKTRDRLPQAKFLMIKTLDFYFSVVNKIKGFDYYWYNEEKTFLFPLLAPCRQKFVWDQHEVPMLFCSGYRRKLFQIIEKKAQHIIHANSLRIDYLKSINLLKYPEKHVFIHNYPDENFVNSKQQYEHFDAFQKWLNGEQYVYLQGLTVKDRHPFNTVSSILSVTNYKIVIVGNVDSDELCKLRNNFSTFDNRVFLAGMVKQLAIPSLLRDAQFSVVLYKTSDPNNRYCEANRMYQAISLGVPVVVGKNESMASVVKDKYGIALNSDGSQIKDLKEAVMKINGNIEKYRANCMSHSNEYVWNDDMIKIEWLIMSNL